MGNSYGRRSFAPMNMYIHTILDLLANQQPTDLSRPVQICSAGARHPRAGGDQGLDPALLPPTLHAAEASHHQQRRLRRRGRLGRRLHTRHRVPVPPRVDHLDPVRDRLHAVLHQPAGRVHGARRVRSHPGPADFCTPGAGGHPAATAAAAEVRGGGHFPAGLGVGVLSIHAAHR